MLFRKILRDARQGLSDQYPYYASLIIALVSFYTLLSLKDQDVFRFLRHQEAEAIRKLNQLIGGVFGLSLFFLFFLVYFACHYQWDRRRKEMGLFLMMGMKNRSFLAF